MRLWLIQIFLVGQRFFMPCHLVMDQVLCALIDMRNIAQNVDAVGYFYLQGLLTKIYLLKTVMDLAKLGLKMMYIRLLGFQQSSGLGILISLHAENNLKCWIKFKNYILKALIVWQDGKEYWNSKPNQDGSSESNWSSKVSFLSWGHLLKYVILSSGCHSITGIRGQEDMPKVGSQIGDPLPISGTPQIPSPPLQPLNMAENISWVDFWDCIEEEK